VLGITPASQPAPSWTEAEDVKLGTMPDGHLAAKLGRTAVAIKGRRASWESRIQRE
jgi:hypothetical protein